LRNHGLNKMTVGLANFDAL